MKLSKGYFLENKRVVIMTTEEWECIKKIDSIKERIVTILESIAESLEAIEIRTLKIEE